jgi:hypothetical protein
MIKMCKCQDCGLEFEKGSEGDNVLFCLRCVLEFIWTDEDYVLDDDMSMNG